jgi:hypothetical protein
MATSVNLGYCAWLAGNTWNDQIGRLDLASETMIGLTRGGVLQSYTNPLAVLASSGMNITVNPGAAVIPSALGASQGAYRVVNPVSQTLTVTTAPASPNSRIDLVVANVVDNGNNTSFSEVQIVTGTAGNPPTAPSAPTDSITLASIVVGSGVTSILQSNITDSRFYTASAGGTVYFPNTTSAPNGVQGVIGYDNANNRFFHWSATGYAPMKIAPFPATEVVGNGNATITGNTGTGGTPATLVFGTQSMSANVTMDGQTDLAITIHWPGYSMATPTNTKLTFEIVIDSTVLDTIYLLAGIGAPTFAYGGNIITYTTSSASGDTPSAGSHTITWKALANNQSTAESVTVVSTSGQNSFLRAQPVTG